MVKFNLLDKGNLHPWYDYVTKGIGGIPTLAEMNDHLRDNYNAEYDKDKQEITFRNEESMTMWLLRWA